jgi:hypothetical protein
VFLPELAMALNNLGSTLSDLRRREDAVRAAEEGLGILLPLLTDNPAIFAPKALLLVRNYQAYAYASGRRPDPVLLAPLMRLLRLDNEPGSADHPGFE